MPFAFCQYTVCLFLGISLLILLNFPRMIKTPRMLSRMVEVALSVVVHAVARRPRPIVSLPLKSNFDVRTNCRQVCSSSSASMALVLPKSRLLQFCRCMVRLRISTLQLFQSVTTFALVRVLWFNSRCMMRVKLLFR
jgi:hypothetical protein